MHLGGHFDLEKMQVDIREYEETMAQPDFWDNQDKAQDVISELNVLKKQYDSFILLIENHEEYELMLEMVEEAADDDLRAELTEGIQQLHDKVEEYELLMLLDGPYDRNNAILELHPGAGGTESQDFGEMLLRMYTRYIEQKGFTFEIIDYQNGDEAGIKSVTILVKGENAYGFLKAENGVHRLVRISPFDSSGRRHTSFVSCEVTPEVTTDVEIEILPEDIRVDVYRASGAGGQHVNKTDSAVRVTHIPTGIVVKCQDGRSQHENRATALMQIRAKVYSEMKAKEEAEKNAERKSKLGTGDRSEKIRTYNYPQNRVTDHRIGLTLQQLDRIMEGKLDDVINALLEQDQKDKIAGNV